MKIRDWLGRLAYTLVQGSLDEDVEDVVYDSRKARPHTVFVCIRGSARDSQTFIPDVLEKGCRVLVTEKDVTVPGDVTVLRVENGRLALAELSAARFGYPAEKLVTIGITGTKGKTTTSYMVKAILEAAGQAGLLPDAALEALLRQETPKLLENARWHVVGGVRLLCAAAEETCRRLGYAPFVLTDRLSCEAREAGRFLSAAAQYHAGRGKALALLAGGETVVHVTGSGLGGRNQELALAAAPGLEGLSDAAVFSFGSDGTDGPTDAAGGYADGRTAAILRALGRTAEAWLDDNDAWHALAQTGGLLRTGPTGTNVNDLSVLLIGKPRLTF